jgi:hypothetical protein
LLFDCSVCDNHSHDNTEKRKQDGRYAGPAADYLNVSANDGFHAGAGAV